MESPLPPSVDMFSSRASTRSCDSSVASDEATARRLEASGSYRILRLLPDRSLPADAADQNRPLAMLLARASPSGPRPGRRGYSALLVTYDHEGIRATVATFSSGSVRPEDALTNDRENHEALPLTDASLRPYQGRITMIVHHEPSASMTRIASMAPVLRSVPVVALRTVVPWGTFGVDGVGLDAILAAHGLFADTATAEGACHTLATVLRADTWRRWPRPPFPYVLQSLEQRRVRLVISGPTYAARDALKQRGFRWSSGEGSIARGWFLDLAKSDADREIAWVATRADLADASAAISEICGK